MRRLLLLFTLWVGPALAAENEKPTLVLVFGAAGESEYVPDFISQFNSWTKAAPEADVKVFTVNSPVLDPIAAPVDAAGAEVKPPNSHARLKQALADERKEGTAELWLVLIGHGTFDGKEAKFNLEGPDVTADELAAWLKPFKRPVVVVDTASASAPFMAKLAAPGRVVVTATRSGYEQNLTRFGKHFAEAIADPKSDLDKDGQVSLLETFLSASHRTNEFYKTEGRLATEHALVDDNGDGLGTPADWFRGVRATKNAKDGAALDGARAQQFALVRSAAEQQLRPEVRAQRDKVELRIATLRELKPKMKEELYYRELERLLLELAAIYDGT
jgi:hypothetical protein